MAALGLEGIRRGPEVVNVTTFLGVDPASSLKNTAKYSAIMAGAMDVYGRVYILEYILDRLPIRTDADIGREGLVDATLRMIEKYRPEKIGWEMDGVGRPIGQLLRQELMKLVDRSPEIGFPMIVEIAAPHDQGKIDKIRNMLESTHKTQKVLQKASMTELQTSQEQFPKSRILDILDAECNMLAVAHVPYVIEHYAEAGDYRLNPGRKVLGDRKVDWEVAIPPVSGQNVRLSENEWGKKRTSCDHTIRSVTRSSVACNNPVHPRWQPSLRKQVCQQLHCTRGCRLHDAHRQRSPRT